MYQYICSSCGAEFSREHDRVKQCPHCGSIWILISYFEDGTGINVKEYEAIRSNAEADRKVKLQCPDCGNIAESYGHIKGTYCCSCGGMPLDRVVEQPLELLKQYRKRNRLSQKLMGWKLDISQNYYSDIESGKRPVTPEIVSWITKNIAG